MAFYEQHELSNLGFGSLGDNVSISKSASFYNPCSMHFGDNSRIDDNCVLSGLINVGRNVHFAAGCIVSGGDAGVIFEDFSGLAYACSVFAQSDDYSGLTMTNPTVPDEFKQVTKKSVFIGRHVIVGAHSVILPGVHLSEGTAIGAMSMVTKDTSSWSIYFGIPAKRLKSRKKDALKLEMLYLNSMKS